MRIAFVSDQHIDSRNDPDSWWRARACYERVARDRPDHLVLLGDTFDSCAAFRRDHARVQFTLERLGFWRRDRLSVVPGNHDVYRLGHHASLARTLFDVARDALVTPFDERAAFGAWAEQLLAAEDRVYPGRVFPFVKRLGADFALWGVDTVAPTLLGSISGYWDGSVDRHLAASTSRNLVAMHHPPYHSPAPRRAIDAVWDPPFGFRDPDYAALGEGLRRSRVEAVVCGHVHRRERRSWRAFGTSVYLVGNSGALVENPYAGLLTVRPGRHSWRRVSLASAPYR